MKIALALALAPILLAGCAATVRPDSPRPTLAGVDTCKPDPDGKPYPMAPGTACLVRVRARDWVTAVPVEVRAGESYRISVTADQFWFDAHYRAAPLVGLDGNPLMNLFAGWKRHPASRWFALMAAVMPDAARGTTVAVQDVTRSAVYHASVTGTLALYPNDASLRLFGRPVFYLNNHGAIWTLVERCEGPCVRTRQAPE